MSIFNMSSIQIRQRIIGYYEQGTRQGRKQQRELRKR
jgi:hypothetical protein